MQIKVFKAFPEELLGVGQLIAANCKGLTVAVDLIAGLLRKKDMRRECWEQVADSIRRHLHEDQQEQSMNILEQLSPIAKSFEATFSLFCCLSGG